MRALALFMLLAAPATAQEAMSAAEFEAYTTGKTLLYGVLGEVYGGEDYLPNRRVRWSFLDGQCQDGVWYEDDGEICFVYDDHPDPVCWLFFETPSGLMAELTSGEGSQVLYETGEADGPLHCLGPEIGV